MTSSSFSNAGIPPPAELSDVVSVVASAPSQGAPKKVDDRAFFDLHTKRRLYNFCASDGAAVAQDWIEKIQSCLQ